MRLRDSDPDSSSMHYVNTEAPWYLLLYIVFLTHSIIQLLADSFHRLLLPHYIMLFFNFICDVFLLRAFYSLMFFFVCDNEFIQYISIYILYIDIQFKPLC